MTLPVIVAPHGSGVTQVQMNAMMVTAIEGRTLELLAAIRDDAARVTATLAALVEAKDTSDHSMARALRVIDTQCDAIARNRMALQYRLEVLSTTRANAQSTDQTITLLKASA